MFGEDGMMQEQHTADDQSHYEISLTAGQAFVAFVLLLLSLAASFAFGLLLGRGQADERLVVRRETPVVTEASALARKGRGEIVELGVQADDFEETASDAATPAVDTAPVVEDEPAAAVAEPAPAAAATTSQAEPVETAPAPPAAASAQPSEAAVKPAEPAARAATPAPDKRPHYAQLLSTGDQKTAEALAVKLIDRGFNTAYVERGATDKGAVFRVRVRFASEQEARAAEAKLRQFSSEVWITAK
jgi:cell division septation protein DedD